MCRQGAWGWVSTRTPLDCACTLQYLPGLSGFQVADQGHVPRDHQSHTSQSARPTGLGLRGTPYPAQAQGLPLESKTIIYLGSGPPRTTYYLHAYLGRAWALSRYTVSIKYPWARQQRFQV